MDTAAAMAAVRQVVSLLESNQIAAAEQVGRTAVGRFPHVAELARLHGVALLQLGQPAAARQALQHAQRLDPQSSAISCNMAVAMLALGDGDAAVKTLEQARQRQPDDVAVLAGLGNALLAVGQPDRAAQALSDALRRQPSNPAIMLNLAAAQLEAGQADAASRHVGQALQLVPDHDQAHALRGHVLAAQQQYEAAAGAWLRAQQLQPNDATHAYQRGLMLEELGRYGDAAAAWREALRVDPDLYAAASQLLFALRRLCRWEDTAALRQQLLRGIAAGADGITPFSFLAEDVGPAWQLRCATNYARGIEQTAQPLRQRLPAHTRRAGNDLLRVGFVSNGFGEHPTGLLTVALFEAMRARTDIELHLFPSGGSARGTIRERLHTAAHGWHDIAGLDDLAAAQCIRGQQIEILVDLRGYGGGSRASLFALRPAPLQVNWLAYPGTSGAAWIDYVIGDEVTIPVALRDGFSERVAWLPRCFQPSDTTRAIPAPPTRRDCGLPGDGVVYVCFNNSYKINQASFQRLLQVLRGVPDSVLWLLGGPEDADQRLRDHAQHAGINPQRLVFMDKLPHPQYLARYQLADLFLDTLPYNAHTTASDALWAGCPVLTVPGDTFAGRVAASLVHHLEMPELIAADAQDFVARAVALGNDAALRGELRARLGRQRQASGLFNMDAFANDLAGLLHRMAQLHRSGQPPHDLPPQ